MTESTLADLELEKLRLQQKRFLNEVYSCRTRVCYRYDWKGFESWCASVGLEALPASDETVSLYFTWALRTHRVSTIVRYTSAIGYFHRSAGYKSPVGQESKAVIRGARRLRKERPTQKVPLTIAQLHQIAKLYRDSGPKGCRDLAILLLGFAAGLRRSELTGLDLGDVQFVPRRGLVVHLRSSKTDQEGRGREIAVFVGSHKETCPVRALTEWLKVRGNWAGPLFHVIHSNRDHTTVDMIPRRMSIYRVHLVVREAVAALGLNPALYGGHSLRAGCATAAAENGASESEIMRITGHRSSEMVRKYIRPVALFPAQDPFRRAL